MQLNIRRKILLSYSISVLIGGLIWVLSYYCHNEVSRQLRVIEEKDFIFSDILEARRYEKNFFLTGHAGHIEQALSYTTSARQRLRELIDSSQKEAAARDFRDWDSDIKAYEASLLTLQTLRPGRSGPDPGLEIRDGLRALYTEFHLQGRKITTNIEKAVSRENRLVQRLINRSKLYHFVTLAALLILASLTAIFIVTDVNRPLKYIESAIRKITRGDYSTMPEISTGDEFESLVNSMNEMIRELNRRSEQMLQTEKLASLGILTSGVAHELNNPLSNISSSVQIVFEELEEGDVELQRELLTETMKEVDRARDTVRALLEFSREGEYRPQEVDFPELIAKTIKLVKSEIPAGVEVSISVPASAVAYVCPKRIQQLLIILFLNALQAMEEKGGVLAVRAWRHEEEGRFVVEVSDTGPGIPEAILSRIFDPFFTTKEVGRGSGLGLSIAHGIVEQHCGRITVDTEVGRGTSFKIILPV